MRGGGAWRGAPGRGSVRVLGVGVWLGAHERGVRDVVRDPAARRMETPNAQYIARFA